MKSNLTKKEFKERLTELTSPEKDFYIITPYNSSGTPFCGTYTDTTFELTRNSFWRQVKAIKIKGEYKEHDNYSTEVTYKVSAPKFVGPFLYITFAVIFIAMNIILLINYENFDFLTILTSNAWLIFISAFIFIYVLGFDWITKKIVDQRFREEFEIGIEDEWEKLAGSNV
jgi:hypothetical protein